MTNTTLNRASGLLIFFNIIASLWFFIIFVLRDLPWAARFIVSIIEYFITWIIDVVEVIMWAFGFPGLPAIPVSFWDIRLFVVSIIVNIVAGIIGIKSSSKIKAGICLVVGFVIVISSFVVSIWSLGFNVVAIANGIWLPVMYIVGAYKLGKSKAYQKSKTYQHKELRTSASIPPPPRLPRKENPTLDEVMAEIGAEMAYERVYKETLNVEMATAEFWKIYYATPEPKD